jgi:hypothetical protein
MIKRRDFTQLSTVVRYYTLRGAYSKVRVRTYCDADGMTRQRVLFLKAVARDSVAPRLSDSAILPWLYGCMTIDCHFSSILKSNSNPKAIYKNSADTAESRTTVRRREVWMKYAMKNILHRLSGRCSRISWTLRNCDSSLTRSSRNNVWVTNVCGEAIKYTALINDVVMLFITSFLCIISTNRDSNDVTFVRYNLKVSYRNNVCNC